MATPLPQSHLLPVPHPRSGACASPPARCPPDPLLPHTLTHLEQLEAEAIHIIREVAAEFANPVML